MSDFMPDANHPVCRLHAWRPRNVRGFQRRRIEACSHDTGERAATRVPLPSLEIFVEVTTRCNLRCSMCVKEAHGQHIAEGDLSRVIFARLTPALPQLDTLISTASASPCCIPSWNAL